MCPGRILTALPIFSVLLILKKYISLGRNHKAVIGLKKKKKTIITFLKQEMGRPHPERRLSHRVMKGAKWPLLLPGSITWKSESPRTLLWGKVTQPSAWVFGIFIFENYVGFLFIAVRIPSPEKFSERWQTKRPGLTNRSITMVWSHTWWISYFNFVTGLADFENPSNTIKL